MINNRKSAPYIGNMTYHNYINNNNNNTHYSKINIPNQKNNFLNKNKQSNNSKTNYNKANLYKFDLNKYPHEIGQINDFEDFDIGNKTFNFSDNNKFKNDFMIDNNIIDNNPYLTKNNINANHNNYIYNANNINKSNNNKLKKNINNNLNINVNKSKNIKALQIKTNNNNKLNNLNKNLYNNDKNQNPNNNENDEESSENLSDIAEEILDTFQGNNSSIDNNYNTLSSPTKEMKFEYNNSSDISAQYKKQKSNDIEIKKTNPFKNEIKDLDHIQINKTIENNIISKDNIYHGIKEKDIGIQTSIESNNFELFNLDNNIENKIKADDFNVIKKINPNNILSNDFTNNENEKQNINKNINNKEDNYQTINITNNTTNNITNNSINSSTTNTLNNNNENNNKILEGFQDKKDFNINNVNITKSLIIINNNNEPTNSADNQIQAFNNINNVDNNINSNIIKNQLSSNHPKEINNSNIILNISYSKDSQIFPDNKMKIDLDKNKKEEKKLEEQNKSTTTNEQDSFNTKKNDEVKNNKNIEIKKKKDRIQINLEDNIYYHYKLESCLTDYYEIYNKNEELLSNDKVLMDLDNYMKILKNKSVKPCIKKFDKNAIKIKLDYKECENLSERDIIPDLYEEEEDDIRSLEKSLERSIDKSFDKSFDKSNEKWYRQSINSLNDKINEAANESYNVSNSNINDSYSNSNNNGRKIINQLQEMFIEEVDEEQNEENEKGDILIDEEDK